MDTPTSDHGLTYEETPVIEPIIEEKPAASAPELQVNPPEPPPSPRETRQGHGSFGATLGMIVLFIILFTVGVGISVALRQWLASRQEKSSQPSTLSTPTPSFTPDLSSTSDVKGAPTSGVYLTPTVAVVDPYAGWKTTQVISGITKAALTGISFKLPPEMLSPICDGTSCASQGTYLPDGSRFTVAARGKGQLLVDARGNIIVTDSSGKSFTTKQITLTNGRKALEYSGLFSGTTVGGYTFSQMRGLMIEVDEDETLEMNHFTPSGVSAEFAKDDVLFDKIVASLTVARFSQATSSATASPTP